MDNMVWDNQIHNDWDRCLKFWDFYYRVMSNNTDLLAPNVLPPPSSRYTALGLGINDVKVVIIGQDPYPTRGEAHGLAFSVQPHVKRTPPSLVKIFREYTNDLGFEKPKTGCLKKWHDNGVMLLNRVLTVEEGKPNSHKGLGWERLSYEIVCTLSSKRDGIVWMLWGKQAQELIPAISNPERHLILTAGHPSPLNSTIPFLGCKHFSKACNYLKLEKEFWKL